MLLKKEQVDRLLILHSGYKSVEEIADIMGLPMMFVESELKRRGYRPIYAKDKQTAPYTLFTEYEKKGNDDMAKKKCLTPEQKAEIIRLREEGVRVSEIAERFDVIDNTIYTVLKKYKEHEEQIADELDRKAVDDAADDDYVCYEVTGDTDIEAYMADRNVKEPAPAATEASSKQENCVEVPADIIPEKAENVKPFIPEGVWEACRVRIEYLRDLIAEEQSAIDNWTAEIKEIEDFLEENKE